MENFCYISDMQRIESDTMSLGDRIKAYEHQFTDYSVDPSLPFLARVDGRAFHTYTAGLKKPFDIDFLYAMNATAKQLVKDMSPVLAYVQSDEITLLFKPTTDPLFSGKLSKLNSILSSSATYWFNKHMNPNANVKGIALFDCRVFNVPDEWEAVNALRFRYKDAVRNAISAVARYKFGHKAMVGLNSDQKLEKIGDDWKQYPMHARYGAFYRRVTVEKPCAPFVNYVNRDGELTRKVTSDTCFRTEVHEYTVRLANGGRANLNWSEDGIMGITNLPEILFNSGNSLFAEDDIVASYEK